MNARFGTEPGWAVVKLTLDAQRRLSAASLAVKPEAERGAAGFEGSSGLISARLPGAALPLWMLGTVTTAQTRR